MDNLKGRINTGFVIEKIPGKLDFEYDFNLFCNPANMYNHELCRMACRFVTVGYDTLVDDKSAEAETGYPYTQPGLKKALDAMDFEHQEIQPKAQRDEVSYFIASREVELHGKEYNVIVAAAIGSYKKTWYSNFDPYGVDRIANGGNGYAGFEEKGIIHLGFADARDYLLERLNAFTEKYPSDKEVKLLLTGHSRGAAAANLLAAKIIDKGGFGNIAVKHENLFSYCFATPNSADIRKVNVKDERYKQIFNIVNPEDFVTQVLPKACGFGKYGTVYSIFGRDNLSENDYRDVKDAMQRVYNEYKDNKPYSSYKDGNKSVAELAKVMAKSMPDIDTFYNKKLKECGNDYSSFEYYKYTLCPYVSSEGTPEDNANKERAMKLMLTSAFDLKNTSPAFRSISQFFVFKEGLGGATGNKVGATYFSDSHRCESYLAFIMSIDEYQLIKTT